ncbi:ectonucleoside triphosphate diphosphohydrolase 6 [Ambystoma mexicanum]|uniref:ectonucleoside triphosphate diphosphohydrolase 6 n=1 Tax=Ambystoma mexicanum TaxID=8296 RepID=UPI0037E77F13
MKISRLTWAFLCSAFIVSYIAYLTWHRQTGVESQDVKVHLPVPASLKSAHVFYGIMFDAGSTGTRIHVFKFTQTGKDTPKLDYEIFRALKPGLSTYADDPDQCVQGILQLLEVAKKEIPSDLWAVTPLVLKATAGLRLLPGEKAQNLLDKVKDIFGESPFYVGEDCVTIMNGTDEGISAWITVNFLTGSLNSSRKKLVGMLDLGGGSTQITFHPDDEKTLQASPEGYITSFQMFNTTYRLYSYSYLGLGLMSARLKILGGIEGQPLTEGDELVTPCLTPGFKTEWQHTKITYKLRGQKAGDPLFESCSNKVEKMLYNKVHKAKELTNLEFYAFSYYYDLAVDVKLIDEEKGGAVTIQDFETAAKKVCKSTEDAPGENPFLCMDLTYICVLLQELGFQKSKVFKLARKINDVETSWALGALFHYVDSLNRERY